MPSSSLYAFILSFLAGISTLIGAFIIFFDKNKNSRVVVLSLSFAAGVMICVSLTDLLPNSYKLISNINNSFYKILLVLIFMVIGIIISMTIDKYIPTNFEAKDKKNLYKIGIISMIAIIMHNIPEGIATFITSTNNIKLGITLTIAIALHNIPEGISIAIPIYHSTGNKKRAFLYAFISGISEIFGAIISFLFLKKYVTNQIMAYLYAIIAGIMIHISIYELLPGAYKENNNSLNKIIKYFIIGFIIMILSHLLMS